MYKDIKIIGKSEMDGIEIGMDNPDGTKCPLGTLTWYGEDDCNAEQDEAFAEKICLAYNKYDALKQSHEKLRAAADEGLHECERVKMHAWLQKDNDIGSLLKRIERIEQALAEAKEIK